MLDCPQTWESTCDIHRVGNDLKGEWLREAGSLEIFCAIVKDEVDTRKLLERLQHATSDKTFEYGSPKAIFV